MDNAQRRTALDLARKQALSWAKRAEEQWPISPAATEEYAMMASMWANVANAMKVGDERADNV
jgi:hypothetical protein